MIPTTRCRIWKKSLRVSDSATAGLIGGAIRTRHGSVQAGPKAEELLAHADAVLNVAGATRFAEEGLKIGRLVYFGTDPGHDEIAFASGQRTCERY